MGRQMESKNTMRMNSVKKKYGSIIFEETFNTTFYTSFNTTYNVPNLYNNWNWRSYGSLGNNWAPLAPCLNGSMLYAQGDSGTNNFWVNMNRSLEGYSINRSYDIVYKFNLNNCKNNISGLVPYNYDDIRVSIGGNKDVTGLFNTVGGLEFRAYAPHQSNGYFYIMNNGTVIATPYSGSLPRETMLYAYIQKRGMQLGVTVNSTGIAPTTPAFTCNMTDTTEQSQSLIVYFSGQGISDYGAACSFDNIKVQLY